jgi:LytS/YehU family sensor histidine kinase
MQLSPHTLFNLLHTIRGNIVWDPPAAQSMIVHLGDLLRRLLAAGELDFSELPGELQFARLYLQLQQQRRGAGRGRSQLRESHHRPRDLSRAQYLATG